MNKYSDMRKRPYSAYPKKRTFSSQKPGILDNDISVALSVEIPIQSINRSFTGVHHSSSQLRASTQTAPIENQPSKHEKINTRRICSLSHRENDRSKAVMNALNSSTKEVAMSPLLNFRQVNRSYNLPKVNDFSNLFHKLDKVVMNKNYIYRKLTLREYKLFELHLDGGSIQYFKIPSRDQMAPLKVNLKRISGRLRVFISKSVPEPNQDLNDGVFAKDQIILEENTPAFRCEYIYMAISAQEDSLFQVYCYFGRDKGALGVDWQKQEGPEKEEQDLTMDSTKEAELRQELKVQLEKRLKKRALLRKLNKNFLSLNKQVRLNSSPRRFKDVKRANRQHEHRRQQVLQKREEFYENKKKKTMDILNRRAFIQQEKLRIQQEAEAEAKLRRKQTLWIFILQHVLAAKSLKEKFILNRLQIIQRLKQCSAARRFQMIFHHSVGGLKGPQLSALRARNLLSMYFINARRGHIIKAKNQLMFFIRDSANVFKVQHAISDYYSMVMRVQGAWKSYKLKMKERLFNLNRMWDTMIEKRISSVLHSKTIKKKTKDQVIAKYQKISHATRIVVLSNYLKERILEYVVRYRSYCDNIKAVLRIGLPTFIQMKGRLDDDHPIRRACAPAFTYIPNEVTMSDLIEKAVNPTNPTLTTTTAIMSKLQHITFNADGIAFIKY